MEEEKKRKAKDLQVGLYDKHFFKNFNSFVFTRNDYKLIFETHFIHSIPVYLNCNNVYTCTILLLSIV